MANALVAVGTSATGTRSGQKAHRAEAITPPPSVPWRSTFRAFDRMVATPVLGGDWDWGGNPFTD